MSGMAGYRLADESSKTRLKRKVLKPDFDYSEEEEAKVDGGNDEYDDLRLKRMRPAGGEGTTQYKGGIMKVSDEKIPKLDGKLGSYYNDNDPFGPRWLESIYLHMAKYYQNKFVQFCSQVAGNLAWTMDQVMDNSDQPSLVRQAAIESLIAKTSDTLKKISAETAKLRKPATTPSQTNVPLDTEPIGSAVPLGDVESEAEKRNKSKRRLPDRFSKRDLFMWLLEGETLNQAHLSMVEKIFEQEGDLHFRWLQMPEIGRWIRLSETMTAAIEYCHNDLLNDQPDLYSIDDLIANYKERFAEMVEKRIRIVKSTRFTTDKGMEVIKTEYVRVKKLLQQLIGVRPREQVSSFIYPPGSFYTIKDNASQEGFRTPLPVRKKKETPEVGRKFL